MIWRLDAHPYMRTPCVGRIRALYGTFESLSEDVWKPLVGQMEFHDYVIIIYMRSPSGLFNAGSSLGLSTVRSLSKLSNARSLSGLSTAGSPSRLSDGWNDYHE